MATTPLHAFCVNLRWLCLELGPSTNEIREVLAREVPFASGGALKLVRDKLSAHVDKALVPDEARAILAGASPQLLGRWVQIAVWSLSELLEPDVYSWQTRDCPPNCIRIMNVEPWVITIEGTDDSMRLVGVDVGTSPKYRADELIERLVRNSSWLFKPGKPLVRLIRRESPVP